MFKPTLILITLTCGLYSVLPAQSFSTGAKGGLNLATLGNKESNLNPRFGYHFGLSTVIESKSTFTIQSELFISLQGAADKAIPERKNKYFYLNLPLLVRLQLNPTTFLNLGPQIGYLLDGKIKDPVQDQRVTDQLRSFDIAIAGGLGFNPVQVISLELRYVNSLNNTSVASPGTGTKFQNKVLQLSATYWLK